jgi:hypothetical protein
LDTRRLLQVWRRSWKRILGRPARFKSGLKYQFTTFWEQMGVPFIEGKMSPWSL